MGLLTKTVIVKWNISNKKWYEEKGYTFTKMKDEFKVKVEDLSKGSHVYVEVECDCEDCNNPNLSPIKWKCYLRNLKEANKYYCKNCNMKLFGFKQMKETKLKNSKSFEEWCIENNRQDVLNRWDYDLNNCLPSEIGYGSAKNCWLKCDKYKEHESEFVNIGNFTSGHNGTVNCKKCNSLGQYIIDNYGKEFLNKIWSNKNTKSSFEYSYKNMKKVWWKCINDEHEDYYRDINGSNKADFRCPECVQERRESFLQEKVRIYLENLNNNFIISHENKCTIVPINPKTKMKLPFDNEINIHGKYLIIEVNGMQHYRITNWHNLQSKRNNTTPEYEFHYQQLKDRYKRVCAKLQRYEYLEIPYWTDDKNETWKQLIDDKINEILNKTPK